MSEDLRVDQTREQPADGPDDDIDDTAVRPALPPEPPPYDDDDLVADEEFMAPGGRKPSRVTRVLLAILFCALGVLIGVQLDKVVGGSAAPAGRSGGSSSAGTGAASGGASGAPGSAAGSSAPAVEGQVASVKAHTLVVDDQQNASHTVTFTDDTTVTKPYGQGAVGVGDAVTVYGSRAADGSVNATSIIVR